MARMSLGQATGGKPGRVQAKAPQQGPKVAARGRQMPAPPKTGPLGLGLGLNAKQRAGFQQAAQGQGGMGSAQWLAQHPQVQNRIANMGGAQGQKVQNFMQTGQRPQPPPAQRQAPGAQPAPQRPPMPLGMVGGNMGQPGGPQGNMAFFGPQGSNMPRPMVNPGMQSVMQSRGMPPEMMQQPPQQQQQPMGQFSPQQFGMDPNAINANPQQAQNYMRQNMGFGGGGMQQQPQTMGGFGGAMGNMASQMQRPQQPMMGFGGGGGYSLGGQPPAGMGTGFGMSQPRQPPQQFQGFGNNQFGAM